MRVDLRVLLRLPLLALVLAGISLAVFRYPELSDTLALRPDRVASGELWLLVTGHLVHFNAAHAIGDVAAFAVWAAAVEIQSRRLFGWFVLASAVLVSLLVMICCPHVSQYRGLSALDCALVALLVALGYEKARARGKGRLARLVLCTGAVLLAKTLYEFVAGRAVLAPDLGEGVALLPEAHGFGVVAGIGSYVAWRLVRARPSGSRWGLSLDHSGAAGDPYTSRGK